MFSFNSHKELQGEMFKTGIINILFDCLQNTKRNLRSDKKKVPSLFMEQLVSENKNNICLGMR